jgi:hypothetical protein
MTDRALDQSRFGTANNTAHFNKKTTDWKHGWDSNRAIQAAPRCTTLVLRLLDICVRFPQ